MLSRTIRLNTRQLSVVGCRKHIQQLTTRLLLAIGDLSITLLHDAQYAI